MRSILPFMLPNTTMVDIIILYSPSLFIALVYSNSYNMYAVVLQKGVQYEYFAQMFIPPSLPGFSIRYYVHCDICTIPTEIHAKGVGCVLKQSAGYMFCSHSASLVFFTWESRQWLGNIHRKALSQNILCTIYLSLCQT